MICPNCDIQMEYKNYCRLEPFYHWEDEETYYQKIQHEKYICKFCNISYIDGVWKVPRKFQPSEKQKNTILFINNHLGMDLKSITKHQCWKDIGKYFESAKKTPLQDYQYYIDI